MGEELLAGVMLAAWVGTIAGAVLFLVEWVAGMTFLAFPFRRGVPFIRRVLRPLPGGLPSGRLELASVTLIYRGTGEWHFRPVLRFFGMSAGTPWLYGQVKASPTELEVVGRLPLGLVVGAFSSAIQQTAGSLGPALVPAAGSVDIRRLAISVVMLGLVYAGVLMSGRDEFLRAVANIGEQANGPGRGAA